MTGSPGERWKVFADGDDVDDIPLWKVLAKIRADDLDEGSKLNAAFLKGIKPRFSWSYNLAIAISSVFGLLAVVFLIGLAAPIRSKSADFFYYGTLLMLAGTIAPHLWRRAYQYGLAVPDTPLALSHPSDLYLHREDMERMLAMGAPKRSGGPGRNVKYAYVEAAFDLRADPRLERLDLNDEAAAVRSLTDWLDEWFDSAANVSGEIPKRDRLTPYARRIYAHLKKSASPDGR